MTTSRPKEIHTPLGSFRYRHIKLDYFRGFQSASLPTGDGVLFALPEKALLDLIYLTPKSDSNEYIHGLRLQNLELFDINGLESVCSIFSGRKMNHACSIIEFFIEREQRE